MCSHFQPWKNNCEISSFAACVKGEQCICSSLCLSSGCIMKDSFVCHIKEVYRAHTYTNIKWFALTVLVTAVSADRAGLWDWRSTGTQRAAGPEKASQCKQQAFTPHSVHCLMSSLQPSAFLNPYAQDRVACRGKEPKPLN